MPKYRVTGEYGPQGHQAISLEIEAENEGHAKNQFCEHVELNNPHEWERMGRRNVSVFPYVEPKAEQKPPQTLWEVFFKNRFSELVRAHTFMDAVEEAKRVCRENNIPMSEILCVKYLMY